MKDDKKTFCYHPEAINSLNKKSELLLGQVTKVTFIGGNKKKFEPDLHVDAYFTEKNIIGKLELVLSDHFGNQIGKRFIFRDEEYQIMENETFNNFFNELIKNKTLISCISVKTLKKLTFNWIEKKYCLEIKNHFMDYLIKECNNLMKEREIWIPVSNLSIQSDFQLGEVFFKPITEEILNYWESQILNKRKNEGEEITSESLKPPGEFLHKFKGLAACVVNVEAEPCKAREIALEKSECSIDFLRFFSPTFSNLKIRSYLDVHHSRDKRVIHYFEVDVKNGFPENFLSEWDVRDGLPYHWSLSNDEIKQIYSDGLNELSELLKSDHIPEFQEKILNSLRLYSQSATFNSISNKLLHIFVSLETLFLKDEQEPVLSNLSHRIAYLIGNSLEMRKEIISTIQKAYKLRSSFTHHGKKVTNTDTDIEKLLFYSSLVFKYLIKNCTHHTHQDFISKIDDIKLSGGLTL